MTVRSLLNPFPGVNRNLRRRPEPFKKGEIANAFGLFPAKGHHTRVQAKQKIEKSAFRSEAVDLAEVTQIVIRQRAWGARRSCHAGDL